MFYSRIPVPKSLGFSNEILNRSTRYLTLVGLVIGSIGAGVFLALDFILPQGLALLFSMLATIFVTGAFHEDGFADFCDGFGGGASPEKILLIMKDSRVGTYGIIGILGILGVKFLSLDALPSSLIPLTLVAGHAYSRLMPVLIIFTSDYARPDATSKIKAVGKRGKYSDLAIASAFALPMLILFPWQLAVFSLPILLLTAWIFKKYIEKKINGYTGDCLGALQQISEVLFYIIILVIINFTY
ncbi:Cobalamin synthase [hydrothermal vent metagenome]|uniref:Adenosylcobinamide-GDP ribazoletransferase n=1 Tax=hydrothermal vent metagenome TaxID=652676 RepID=A0A3B0TL22_9ZZZZ